MTSEAVAELTQLMDGQTPGEEESSSCSLVTKVTETTEVSQIFIFY